MNRRQWLLVVGMTSATLGMMGCASEPRNNQGSTPFTATWRGRLALLIRADAALAESKDQSFTASFELQGTPTNGTLALFTPFGSTAALIQWTPMQATLEAKGDTRHFDGLPALTASVLGTTVPIGALFAWLQNQQTIAEGWDVDLSEAANGKIVAQRLAPSPQAHLRVVLEQ